MIVSVRHITSLTRAYCQFIYTFKKGKYSNEFTMGGFTDTPIQKVIYRRGLKHTEYLVELFRVLMNYPAASYGVSKTARNEASFGEFTLRD